MDLGLIILAGGLSSRLGKPKACLPWGKGTLLTDLVERAGSLGFKEILISLGDDKKLHAAATEAIEELELIIPIRIVADQVGRCGPMGGIYSALTVGTCDSYGAVSVDMPFFPLEKFFLWKEAFLKAGTMKEAAVKVVTPLIEDQVQPLSALYHRSCAVLLKRCIDEGMYSLKGFFDQIKQYVIYVEENHSSCYININTQKDYQWARAKAVSENRKVPVLSVVAGKRKTGKTTLVEALVQRLSARGIDVGLVKSDAHGFEMDREGSDTDRTMRAGAKMAAIVGPDEIAIRIRTKEKMPLYELSQTFDVDLVILETRTQGIFPVVEVFQEGYTENFISPAVDLVETIEIKDGRVCHEEALDLLVEQIRTYIVRS